MRRILLVMAAAALMAAMLMASAMPAFAQATDTTPNCHDGQGNAAFNQIDPNGPFNSDNFFKHLNRGGLACE